MDTGLLVFLGVIVSVIALIRYVWTHRDGALARGISAAGGRYNELNGQGRPIGDLTPPAEVREGDPR